MLQSMTGFFRAEGRIGAQIFAWELRCVNARGLDIRFRLPAGMEGLEVEAKTMLGHHFGRGTLHAALYFEKQQTSYETVLNRSALEALLSLRSELNDYVDMAPLTFETLLAVRGVIEMKETNAAFDVNDKANVAAFLSVLENAMNGLKVMREREGASLEKILAAHADEIERLTVVIETDPSRSKKAIQEKLLQQVTQLLSKADVLDKERLYSEAAVIATRVDICEELDRLKAHSQSLRQLLTEGTRVGRKLDFLSQELIRETNTICAKSNAVTVTKAALELKVVIDRLREQVQNVE